MLHANHRLLLTFGNTPQMPRDFLTGYIYTSRRIFALRARPYRPQNAEPPCSLSLCLSLYLFIHLSIPNEVCVPVAELSLRISRISTTRWRNDPGARVCSATVFLIPGETRSPWTNGDAAKHSPRALMHYEPGVFIAVGQACHDD